MTPEGASEPNSKVEVKENLEKTRVIARKYPRLVKGSKVRLFHKKDAYQRPYTAPAREVWSRRKRRTCFRKMV